MRSLTHGTFRSCALTGSDHAVGAQRVEPCARDRHQFVHALLHTRDKPSAHACAGYSSESDRGACCMRVVAGMHDGRDHRRVSWHVLHDAANGRTFRNHHRRSKANQCARTVGLSAAAPRDVMRSFARAPMQPLYTRTYTTSPRFTSHDTWSHSLPLSIATHTTHLPALSIGSTGGHEMSGYHHSDGRTVHCRAKARLGMHDGGRRLLKASSKSHLERQREQFLPRELAHVEVAHQPALLQQAHLGAAHKAYGP